MGINSTRTGPEREVKRKKIALCQRERTTEGFFFLLFFVYSADADPSAASKLQVQSAAKPRRVQPVVAPWSRGPSTHQHHPYGDSGAQGPDRYTGSFGLPSPKV